MASTNDVIIAVVGLATALVAGKIAYSSITKKSKKSSKIGQYGIGHVTNTAVVDQSERNEENERIRTE